MFKKTEKRIYATLMIIASVLIVLIITPSLIAFTGMFYNVFRTSAKNRLDRSISSCRVFLDSVMSTTDTLAYNQTVQNAVTNGSSGGIVAVLDSACTYSLTINAITVYGLDGKIYTSSGVINPPSIEELRTRQDIAEFIDDSEAVDFVSLRTTAIIRVYGNVPYDEDSGIISCCRKIFGADGRAVGYIFSDVFPETLFSYFDYSDDNNLKDCVSMINFDGGRFISSPENAETYLTAPSNTISGNRLIVSSARNFYGGSVRLAVSIAPLYSSIAIISAVLLLCGAGLLTATHFIARKNALTVAERLENLLTKMKESTARFTDK